MARGYFRCLRHLPCDEVTYAELLEQSFVMKLLNGRQCRFDRRGTVAHHQIEDLNLAGLQARQGFLKYPLQVLRFVAAKVSGEKPRGHAEPLGGAEITHHLFAASVAIAMARVDLVVAKFREGAKHCVCGRSVMNPGAVSAVAERHGAEGNVRNRCFGHSNRLASLRIAAP